MENEILSSEQINMLLQSISNPHPYSQKEFEEAAKRAKLTNNAYIDVRFSWEDLKAVVETLKSRDDWEINYPVFSFISESELALQNILKGKGNQKFDSDSLMFRLGDNENDVSKNGDS